MDSLLLQSSSPAALRGMLLAYAAAHPGAERGNALLHAGLSYEREGQRDSAILCYREAVAARGEAAERLALADMLLRRRAPGDLAGVFEVTEPALAIARRNLESHGVSDAEGRRAWALYLSDRGDSALRTMRRAQPWLLSPGNRLHREWIYRLGVLELEHGNVDQSIDLLAGLAVESRYQDRSLMRDLHDAATKAQKRQDVEFGMKHMLQEHDAQEKAVLDALGGSRVSFVADDGFPLSGIAFLPPARARARAIVMLRPPETDPAAFDSLSAVLRRAGFALLLLDIRGSGRSVAPEVPSPDTWRGREIEIQTRVAADVRPALRALAAAGPVDTTRYVVGGIGSTAPIAVEAAAADPRAALLFLVSPEPSPVERGVMRARIASLRRPVFYHLPSDDFQTHALAEALYQAGDVRSGRISESELVGRGPANFRQDRAAGSRLIRWLEDAWPPGSPSAPRRSPRGG